MTYGLGPVSPPPPRKPRRLDPRPHFLPDVSAQLDGVSGPLTGTADVMSAPSLDAREVAFNGTVLTSTDLFATTPTNIGEVAAGRFSFTFEPYSITLVSLASG